MSRTLYQEAVHHTKTGTGGVTARGLGKRFGEQWALRDLDLDVVPGSILGLLGHNGAGKTTAIRILTTLSEPTEGSASVAGIDVTADPTQVRRRIGVAAQQATVDGLMSAHKNLVMVGRLHHLTKAEAQRRAHDLLERLDLADAAEKLVKSFSGGMRRRLDLAASLVAEPEVLFLDEPTTGLDPRSRNDLWAMLRDLVRNGTTIILTTQYLEEADQLADDVVVLDHGRTVAHGTPEELKSQIGTERIDVTVGAVRELEGAVRATEAFASNPATLDEQLLVASIPVIEGTRLMEVMRALDAAGIDAVDLNRRQATLDDVFLTLTGEKGSDSDAEADPDSDSRNAEPTFEEVPT
ncbi:MAG: Daunorubicin resistance transporter, ATP-binding protein [Actinomycetia bacterium]|nr:Daunorubicin resistance transporter, ATP-binding protein [Actinomycetes bacterium]